MNNFLLKFLHSHFLFTLGSIPLPLEIIFAETLTFLSSKAVISLVLTPCVLLSNYFLF